MATNLVNYMNESCPFLTFTHHFSTREVEYLDVKLVKDTQNNCFCSKIFRKNTYCNAFLHFSSNHPLNQKKSIFKGQLVRATRMCSTLVDFEEECSILKNMFQNRGYPIDFLDNLIDEVTFKRNTGFYQPLLQGIKQRNHQNSMELVIDLGEDAENPLPIEHINIDQSLSPKVVDFKNRFILTYNKHIHSMCSIVKKNWEFITNNTHLFEILGAFPGFTFKRGNAQKGIPHICQFCGNAFSSKHHLAQHTMFKHPDPLVKKVALRCSRHKHVKDLSQVLQNTESVTEKVENKPCFLIEGKLYSANESDKSASVLDHSVMEEKPHVCKNCGMLFSDLSLLNKHKQTHRGKRIACTECGKLFTSSHHVKRHQVVHTGEKPFDCTDCGKRFSRLSHVRRHRLIHTGEKPFKCDQCDKGFSSPSHVKRHYVTHTGEKPFFCTDCGKRFTRLAHLQRHQQGHRDPPLHKCTRCEKCFKNDLQLKRHLQRHENCLQNCPECGRPFFNLLQFNQHMLKHVKKKSFVCTEFSLSSASATSFERE
ncbi:oocyte zinc finger protein XlCOF6-like [Protopterus annectens]|uniref:oocyte zinc finger protein XlCOF6-like n=1 Tax=Protopterus annectens TaxID=7888 RepID=UPI001CFACA29|nr:oocyte zinc finger protein XlCOF6-like [Protopterus annectens]